MLYNFAVTIHKYQVRVEVNIKSKCQNHFLFLFYVMCTFVHITFCFYVNGVLRSLFTVVWLVVIPLFHFIISKKLHFSSLATWVGLFFRKVN